MNFGALLASMAVLLLWSSFYIVNEFERAILLRFGEVVNPNVAPGLHFRAPLMHRVRKFDGRLQVLDSDSKSFLTSEKKRLIVDYYSLWRVVDVQRFYQKTNGEITRANELLAPVVEAELRKSFGERLMHDVIAGEREAMIEETTSLINQGAERDLGVEVLDVRIKGIDLPPQVSESVYNRMSSEREKEARKFRYEGRKAGEEIRAAADKTARQTLAEAYNKAEVLKGEGDAQAARTYAGAHQADPGFYSFSRSLEAYQQSFGDEGSLMLLGPDSDFFKYLRDPGGKP
jgi:membrane protease subunit HflC